MKKVERKVAQSAVWMAVWKADSMVVKMAEKMVVKMAEKKDNQLVV